MTILGSGGSGAVEVGHKLLGRFSMFWHSALGEGRLCLRQNDLTHSHRHAVEDKPPFVRRSYNLAHRPPPHTYPVHWPYSIITRLSLSSAPCVPYYCRRDSDDLGAYALKQEGAAETSRSYLGSKLLAATTGIAQCPGGHGRANVKIETVTYSTLILPSDRDDAFTRCFIHCTVSYFLVPSKI